MQICESLSAEKKNLVKNLQTLFEQNTELQQDVQLLTRALEMKDQDSQETLKSVRDENEKLKSEIAQVRQTQSAEAE